MLKKYLHINLQANKQKLANLEKRVIFKLRRQTQTDEDDKRIGSFENAKSSSIDGYLRHHEHKKNKSVIIDRKKFKLHTEISPVSKSNYIGIEKLHRRPDIIKLPIKLQKMKKSLQKAPFHEINRPCRHLHNHTTQQKPRQHPIHHRKHKKKYKKIESTKNIEYRDIDDNEEQKQIRIKDGFHDEVQGQQNMPNNYKLMMNRLKFVQSKVFKVQEADQIKQYMNDNKINIDQKNIKNQETIIPQNNQQKIKTAKNNPKQQPTQTNFSPQSPPEPQTQIFLLNPLKIPLQYHLPYPIKLNQQIQHILQLTIKQPKIKIYTLPTQDKIYTYIKKYVPLTQFVNVQQLIISVAFQIEVGEGVEGGDGEQEEVRWLYFGEKKNGKYEGVGVLVSEIEVKEGVWENGVVVKGAISNQIGVYTGQMDAYGKSGTGQFKYSSGCSYKGFWLKNQRSGNGYFKFSTKQSYLGQWKQNNFEGRGVLKTRLSTYEGEFKNSMREGQGKQKFKNGDQYQGIFMKNLPSKFGKYTWKSGITYEGQFQNGMREGHGILNAPSILKYEGNFKKDLPSGMGKAVYNNGDEYHGLFYQGQRSGRGDLVCSKKKEFYTGDWLNDKLVHELQ